jgi:hypothetical protein
MSDENDGGGAVSNKPFVRESARKFAMAQTACDNEIAIARHINRARLDIAANGVTKRASFVKEPAPGGTNLEPTGTFQSSHA